MLKNRVTVEKMLSFLPMITKDESEVLLTYLEAGGMFPILVGKKKKLYLYDASGYEDDRSAYVPVADMKELVMAAVDTCIDYQSSFEFKRLSLKRGSREYTETTKLINKCRREISVLSEIRSKINIKTA